MMRERESRAELDTNWKAIFWSQFGAAIDMLENALRACPDKLWDDDSQPRKFWYIVYHTLFWLDLYLSGSVEGFASPAPFSLDKLDSDGLHPSRTYSKDELQTYLNYCRSKCQATIETLTAYRARLKCKFDWGEVVFLELLFYNMRHVQEHASQLCLILGQQTGSAPDWVTRTKRGRAA